MITLGKPAPDFQNALCYHSEKRDTFSTISLGDFKGKWLVFFFYPRDFTFICPTELKAFSEHEAEFEKLGAKLLACSTDSEWSHKNWFENDLPQVKYPVIADTTQKIARDYQVLNEADGSAERGLFIIDPQGTVRYVLVSAGSVGRNAKETLRVLEALQTGERCPAEWTPGGKTLGKA